MKRTIILLISLLLLNCGITKAMPGVEENTASTTDSIKILSSPDLYNLSVKWAEEYDRLNPEAKIEIINVSDDKIADNILNGTGFGFVSNNYYSGFENVSIWKIVIGRDIIIPVINSKNPYLGEISKHGISSEEFSQFINNADSKKWGTLLKNNQNTPANYYWINDETVNKGLSEFLKTDKLNKDGFKVESGEEMISAIQKDPYAIGFCKMVDILDFKSQSILENITMLPIDRNGNGLIDYNEKIYDDFNAFSRGVWIGKYPKALFSNIYSVSSKQPENKNEVAFLKWVLTDGQQFLYTSGYSDLLVSERQTTADNLSTAKIYAGAPIDQKSPFRTILLIIIVLIVTFIIIDALVRYFRRQKITEHIHDIALQPVLNENSLIVPNGLYFDKTHTWAFMEQNGIVKVGIDDFLQHITGNVTRIKMKSQGEKVKKGEQILTIIQNGKQLNLYAPISGIIREQNSILETNSSILNSSPYNDGWVYKIEPTNWLRENQLLFMAEKQRQFIKNEFSRLKDFLVVTLSTDKDIYPQFVMQDGGELREGILSNLGPKEWEDFQTKFIDPSRQIWFYELY
jgi:glycine cleavage system H lipoate-binding protein/ABC-type phosphate transport system substrate-binding protein